MLFATVLIVAGTLSFTPVAHAADIFGGGDYWGNEGWDTYSFDSGFDNYSFDNSWDTYSFDSGFDNYAFDDSWDTYSFDNSWDVYESQADPFYAYEFQADPVYQYEFQSDPVYAYEFQSDPVYSYEYQGDPVYQYEYQSNPYVTVSQPGGYSYTSTPYYPTPRPPSYPPITPRPPVTPQPPYYPPVTPKPTPTCTITSTQIGNGATLQWSSNYATSAQLSGYGSVSTSGTRTVTSFTGTRSYTLQVAGPGGTNTCSTTVTVQQEAPTCNASVHPYWVLKGGAATLTWETTDATSVHISGIGAVAKIGARTLSNIQQSTTYTVTATGPGGTRTCNAQVLVKETPPPYGNAPTCWIQVNPNSVYQGNQATVTWGSTNATSMSISTLGTVSTSGSRSIYPTTSQTYTGTVYGPNGTATCQGSVGVLPYEPPYNPPYNQLSCVLTANPSTIANGASSYLSWTSTGATSAWLSDGIGSVAVNGSVSVRPETSRHYTLTVRDVYGAQQTCAATVNVQGQPYISIYSNPYPQPLSYVALSQVPYTGFDFGIVGNTLYWFLMIALAAAAAYAISQNAHTFRAAFAGVMTRQGSVDDARIIHEAIIMPQASTPMREEVQEPIMESRASHDTMILEEGGEGDMPRITLKRS